MNNTLQDIMGIDANNLKERQYEALKAHMLSVLNGFVKQLEADNMEACYAFLDYSPSGDCMGCENTFINFEWKGAKEDQYGYDAGKLLEIMAGLKGTKIANPLGY